MFMSLIIQVHFEVNGNMDHNLSELGITNKVGLKSPLIKMEPNNFFISLQLSFCSKIFSLKFYSHKKYLAPIIVKTKRGCYSLRSLRIKPISAQIVRFRGFIPNPILSRIQTKYPIT